MKLIKKMIFVYIIVLLVVIVSGVLIYKNFEEQSVVRDCTDQAKKVLTASSIVPDIYQVSEESFYLCLFKKGLDIKKYKYNGDNMSEKTKNYIESMKESINK